MGISTNLDKVCPSQKYIFKQIIVIKKQENPLPSYNRFKLNSLWLFSVKNFKIYAYVYIICLLQLAFRKTSTIFFRLYYKEVTISGSQKLLLCSRNIVKRQQKSKFLQGSAGRGRRRSTRARELGAKSVGQSWR